MKSFATTKQYGFTLAELLIALAILGVIATFSIPKILNAQQNQQKNAIFKESIGAISAAVYNYCVMQPANINQYDFMISQVNTVTQCPNNAYSEGCSPSSTLGEQTGPGFILANGASIAGIDRIILPANYTNGFVIDWNGLNPPNVDGDDQMRLGLNFSSTIPWSYSGVTIRPCTVGPINPSSITLFNQVFSN